MPYPPGFESISGVLTETPFAGMDYVGRVPFAAPTKPARQIVIPHGMGVLPHRQAVRHYHTALAEAEEDANRAHFRQRVIAMAESLWHGTCVSTAKGTEHVLAIDRDRGVFVLCNLKDWLSISGIQALYGPLVMPKVDLEDLFMGFLGRKPCWVLPLKQAFANGTCLVQLFNIQALGALPNPTSTAIGAACHNPNRLPLVIMQGSDKLLVRRSLVAPRSNDRYLWQFSLVTMPKGTSVLSKPFRANSSTELRAGFILKLHPQAVLRRLDKKKDIYISGVLGTYCVA